MFTTKTDTVWPSTESCEKMCEILKSNNYAYPYKHIAFEHMSHMMIEYCGKEIKYFMKSEKENPEVCFAERDVMGKETVKWIKGSMELRDINSRASEVCAEALEYQAGQQYC